MQADPCTAITVCASSITHPFTSVAHQATPMGDAAQSADLPTAQPNADPLVDQPST
jgi:hypothetical protein